MTRSLLVVLALAGTAGAAPRSLGRAERVEHYDSASPPARGPAHALVTVEVFFVPGPTMPATALRQLAALQDKHPARMRLVYRVVKGTSSLLVPTAALEAHAQGRFFEFLDELARARVSLKKEDVVALAGRAGLDTVRVGLADRYEHYRDVLEDNQRRLERLHAPAAPSVLFNGVPPQKLSLTAATPADLEHEYSAAYDRAIDKLDRGYQQRELADAFDDEALHDTQPVVVSPGGPDDAADRSLLDHALANPPLALDGLPSLGKPGVAARVPVVILCRPNDPQCSNLLRVVESEVRLYPDEVRLVWAPLFDVTREDAAELSLLADAALCAEAIGSNQGELTTSPGWVWVKEMYVQAGRGSRRKPNADKLIDSVATKLDVDGRALSACRARMANTALAWIDAARRAGVPRSPMAVVILGGRIYDGLTDQELIHELVEAELAPGVLGSLPRWAPSSPDTKRNQ